MLVCKMRTEQASLESREWGEAKDTHTHTHAQV